MATSAVTSEATQHLFESDSENFPEHSDVDYCEIAPLSPKQPRICNDDIDNFEGAFQSNSYDSTSSESDFAEDLDSNEKLRAGLVEWVNEYKVKHNAVDSLLKILNDSGHDQLPGSARSLIKTARYVPLTEKSGMDYIYFPVKEELMRQFLRYPTMTKEKVTSLEISLNIDGLPLFSSSNKSLWPVLCGIMNVEPVAIFPVALTYGSSKPTDLLFLEETVGDLNHLLERGLNVGGRVIPVELRCVVCDAPARALIKGTKLYSGYFGCDKCAQKGLWLGRITYPETRDLDLRTDLSFRCQSNSDHHRTDSPFCKLPMDMIMQFSIDYMHQLCLGVMRKLLLIWMKGNRDVRISSRHVGEISENLLNLKSAMPNNFTRKPRGLNEIERWKATEFRQFLLYTGQLALKEIIRPELYSHFLSLSVASRILVSPTLVKSHWQHASELLVYFVEQGRVLYGKEFIVYNVHSMIHLAAEAYHYGGLDKCSSFPFENYMQKLKKMVRSGRNPLAQLVKRLSESHATKIPEAMCASEISTKKPNNVYILDDR